MKKTTQGITHVESARRRRLQLSREAIKTLRADELSVVNGGCDTSSFTTERLTGKC